MPRKRRNLAPAPESIPPSAPGQADITELVEADDAPDVAKLVARFRVEIDARLAEQGQRLGACESRWELKLAQLEEVVRRLDEEGAKTRRVFDDLREAAARAVREMTELAQLAHASAEEAKEASKVYEKLQDSRPDLLERIMRLGEIVGQYRCDYQRLDDLMTELSNRVSSLQGYNEKTDALHGVVDALGGIVHDMNGKRSLATVAESKESRR